MKSQNRNILVVVILIVVALSYVGYNNYSSSQANQSTEPSSKSIELTAEQIEYLKEKVGAESFDIADYDSYMYVGIHKNILEADDTMHTTISKVAFVYVMQEEKLITALPPALEIASTVNGTIEQLIEPELGWKDNKVIITSRVLHQVESNDETLSKTENIALSIQL